MTNMYGMEVGEKIEVKIKHLFCRPFWKDAIVMLVDPDQKFFVYALEDHPEQSAGSLYLRDQGKTWHFPAHRMVKQAKEEPTLTRIKAPLPKWITDKYGDTDEVRLALDAFVKGREYPYKIKTLDDMKGDPGPQPKPYEPIGVSVALSAARDGTPIVLMSLAQGTAWITFGSKWARSLARQLNMLADDIDDYPKPKEGPDDGTDQDTGVDQPAEDIAGE